MFPWQLPTLRGYVPEAYHTYPAGVWESYYLIESLELFAIYIDVCVLILYSQAKNNLIEWCLDVWLIFLAEDEKYVSEQMLDMQTLILFFPFFWHATYAHVRYT